MPGFIWLNSSKCQSCKTDDSTTELSHTGRFLCENCDTRETLRHEVLAKAS